VIVHSNLARRSLQECKINVHFVKNFHLRNVCEQNCKIDFYACRASFIVTERGFDAIFVFAESIIIQKTLNQRRLRILFSSLLSTRQIAHTPGARHRHLSTGRVRTRTVPELTAVRVRIRASLTILVR